MTALRPFHLAFPVHNLEAARAFYGKVLACPQGREDTHWIDYNLYGHQIVAHLDETRATDAAAGAAAGAAINNAVDGDAVPVPHFGVVLTVEQFADLQTRLEACEETRWVIKPRVRFAGEVGEQHTMFLLDPSGNALEFKAFADDSQLFAH